MDNGHERSIIGIAMIPNIQKKAKNPVKKIVVIDFKFSLSSEDNNKPVEKNNSKISNKPTKIVFI